jgi:hypothetical protein
VSSVDLTDDDIAWVRAYAAEVQKTFGQEFADRHTALFRHLSRVTM